MLSVPLPCCLAQGSALLIIGRIIQGISAACIMPATIALVKAYFEGADDNVLLVTGPLVLGVDQVFVHLQVVQSQHIWVGDGFSSFLLSSHFLRCGLLKILQKVKRESTGAFKFDYTGLVIFIITMLALNLFITFGADLGWTSPTYNWSVQSLQSLEPLFSSKLKESKDIVLIDFSII